MKTGRQPLLRFLLLSIGLLSAAAAADDAGAPPQALVQTQVPRRGSFPQRLEAYGTAAPAIDASLSLSLQAEGRVSRIAVAPGEPVHAGQLLLEFTPSAAASSAYQQARTALDVARQDQARVGRLLAQQLATRDQQAQADKAVSDAQSALDALRQQGAGATQQLTAPFDGVVSAIAVAQGDRVAPGAALATVARRGGWVVAAGVEPSQRGRLKPGQAAQLAPLLDGEPALRGSVLRVGRVLDPKTHLIDADIAVDGEPLPGAAYRARIEVGELQGWLVPRDAVLSDDQGSYLFQVAGGKARRVAVRRLDGDDETSVVEGPLDPVLLLVVQGNYQLGDGAGVRQDAAAAADAARP